MTDFAPFNGIDQRSNPLMLKPTDSTDLSNVKLHPTGTIAKRDGTTLWEQPTTASIDHLAYLEKHPDSRTILYAVSPAAIYRALLQTGFDPAWETAHSFGSSVDGLRPISTRARFIEDSNTAAPTHRGDCLYYADGQRTPLICKGLAAASGSMEAWPEGDYGTGPLYSGTAGYPGSLSYADEGGDDPRNWDDDPPSGLFLRGEGRRDRMYAWGFNDDPNRIDYSELGVPWNFLRYQLDGGGGYSGVLDGRWFYSVAADNDYVVSVTGLHDSLIVLKAHSTQVWRGTHGVDFQMVAQYPVGCVSHHSVIRVGTDLYWWSEQGPVSLSGVERYGDLEYSNIGIKITDEIDALSESYLDCVCVSHDRRNYRLVWFAPTGASDTNDKAFCFYYDEPKRWSVWEGAYTCKNCVLEAPGHEAPGDLIYGGGSDGYIHTMNTGTYDGQTTDGSGLPTGTTIEAYYVTNWIGSSDLRMRPRWIDVIVGNLGAEDMQIYAGWEYTSGWSELGRVIKTLGEPSAYWGHAIWGTAVWGETAEAVKRWSIDGTGFYLRLKFVSIEELPFQLYGWKPALEQLGTR